MSAKQKGSEGTTLAKVKVLERKFATSTSQICEFLMLFKVIFAKIAIVLEVEGSSGLGLEIGKRIQKSLELLELVVSKNLGI